MAAETDVDAAPSKLDPAIVAPSSDDLFCFYMLWCLAVGGGLEAAIMRSWHSCSFLTACLVFYVTHTSYFMRFMKFLLCCFTSVD